MEEADALASRVGILSKRLLDVGTTQHLRNKHGHGFHVHLVLEGSPHVAPEDMQRVEIWIKKHFQGAELEGKPYNGQMRFNLPSTYNPYPVEDETSIEMSGGTTQVQAERSVSQIFVLLEQNKEAIGVEFYSVSPSTFDEVFLKAIDRYSVGEEDMPARKKRWWRFGSK
jgi:ATP-binding cassette subfamily A (ABC1) protein 3